MQSHTMQDVSQRLQQQRCVCSWPIRASLLALVNNTSHQQAIKRTNTLVGLHLLSACYMSTVSQSLLFPMCRRSSSNSRCHAPLVLAPQIRPSQPPYRPKGLPRHRPSLNSYCRASHSRQGSHRVLPDHKDSCSPNPPTRRYTLNVHHRICRSSPNIFVSPVFPSQLRSTAVLKVTVV